VGSLWFRHNAALFLGQTNLSVLYVISSILNVIGFLRDLFKHDFTKWFGVVMLLFLSFAQILSKSLSLSIALVQKRGSVKRRKFNSWRK
jgi:isoprenylcysteine carboxyl methyltransferase (ICMT) family protein YpbQ